MDSDPLKTADFSVGLCKGLRRRGFPWRQAWGIKVATGIIWSFTTYICIYIYIKLYMYIIDVLLYYMIYIYMGMDQYLLIQFLVG